MTNPRPVIRILGGAPLAVILLLAALSGCGGASAEEIVVLHSGDSYGYFEDCGCMADSTGGLAKRAWIVDSIRQATDAPILLVDTGDFTGGENAYGAALGRVMLDAMEVMGYDAFTLGEWDLNQGMGYVRSIVTDTPVAWVHTNYQITGLENEGHRTLVVEKSGRRIGIIGLLNPTIQLNPVIRDSVTVDEDIVGVTQQAVNELQAEGVDAVVVVSHLSYRGDRALAGLVSGIDLIVSGHGGKSLTQAEVAAPGTWLVAAGDLGRFLGHARLVLEEQEEGPALVREATGGIVPLVPSIPDDPRLLPLFEAYEEERQALMRREIDARRSTRYFQAPAVPLEGGAQGRLETSGS